MDRKVALLLFLLVSGVGIVVSSKIGPAWDEPDNIYAGGIYFNFLKDGFDTRRFDNLKKDTSYFDSQSGISYYDGRIYPLDRNLSHLPPFHTYFGTAVDLAMERFGFPKTGATVIIAFHIATAFFFALMVVTVYLFSRFLGLPVWAALFAAVTTFLNPTLFGHGFSNIKDTAQAAMVVVSLYLLVRGSIPGIKRSKYIIFGGITFGLALATKFNAIYIPIIWGTWAAMQHVKLKRKNEKSNNFTFYIVHFTFVIVVGLATAFLFWPYLWVDTLRHVREVFGYFTSVGNWFPFLWQGVVYKGGAGISYWWYVFANLLVTTPLPILLLLCIGIVDSIKHRERRILFIWTLVPLIRTFVPNAALYDGLRHFVEILPPLMILSAFGLLAIWKSKFSRFIGVVAIVHLLWIAVAYFPYGTGYLNVLAKNPNTGFDRDIEGLSIKEGVDYLRSRYGVMRLWVPVAGHLSWYYLSVPPDAYVYSAAEADSIILINKTTHVRQQDFHTSIANDFRIDQVIKRGDAIFGWVYRRNKQIAK